VTGAQLDWLGKTSLICRTASCSRVDIIIIDRNYHLACDTIFLSREFVLKSKYLFESYVYVNGILFLKFSFGENWVGHFDNNVGLTAQLKTNQYGFVNIFGR
jgi:hypothetical protein